MLQNYFSKTKFSVSCNWAHLGMKKNGRSEFILMCLGCLRHIWLFQRILINLTQSLGRIEGSKRQGWKKSADNVEEIFLNKGSWVAARPARSRGERVETQEKKVRVTQVIRPQGPRERAVSKREIVFFQQGSAGGLRLPESIFYPLPIPFALLLNSLRTRVDNIHTTLHYVVISSLL